MSIGSLLVLQMFLYHMTTAAVYNYNETSEGIPYLFNPFFLSGFRNIAERDFIIGGLFPVYDCVGFRLIELEWVEAMLFAIDQINNDMSLLPNLTIGYDVRDTCNDDRIGFIEALNIILDSDNSSSSFLGIVGPAADHVTRTIASLFGLYEIPIISYASSSAALSNKNLFEYFLRTVPSSSLQSQAMVDLVSHFGWDYVSVIFTDDYEYGDPGSDAFVDQAMKHGICVDVKIGIPPLEISRANFNEYNNSIVAAANTLLNSTSSVRVVIVFTDPRTVYQLFTELNKTNSTRKFVWIASDAWANSDYIYSSFPEIVNGTFGFQPYTEYIEEFADYFSQLTPSTNVRDPFFQEYHELYCNENGTYCPDGGLTSHPYYIQHGVVPLVIDAVYAFAHALHNFLDNNCDSPLRWDRATRQCDGMKNNLTGENLLGYLHNVTFKGIQDRIMSFDKDGDPTKSVVYEVSHLQINDSGQYESVTVGFWSSAYQQNGLVLNNADGIEKVISICSEPCNEGMIRSITNQNCPSCFKCIPCVGSTYSNNSHGTNCSLCDDNHWGNDPLSGSTHCVPVKVQHLDYSNGWSIVSMCIAGIALIILIVIIVTFVINWNTPVVKSSGREQMVMLLVGIGICCILTFVIVAPPSTAVCVFRRIDVWFWFSLAFGALLVKIIRVARIFYSIKSSVKRPPLTKSIHQVIFTIAIVSFQLLLVLIGLIIDHPVVKRDPEIVTTSFEQTGNAPEIIETCVQPHTAILVLSLVYNSALIIGCTIFGLITIGFPENFNEAKHVMFTSFTLMVVWVLFIPVYLYTEDEFRPGVLALGIILSAVALMAGIFFPRVFIIVFQKHKNTQEYASKQNTGSNQATDFSVAFQRSKTLT